MQFTTIFTLALASVATAAPTNEARQSYTPCCYDITTGGGALNFPGASLSEYTTSTPGNWCTGVLTRDSSNPDSCELGKVDVSGYCASGSVTPQTAVIACAA